MALPGGSLSLYKHRQTSHSHHNSHHSRAQLAVTSHERRCFLSATHVAVAPYSLIRSRKNWSRVMFLNLYWWRTLAMPPAGAGISFVLSLWSFPSSHSLASLMWAIWLASFPSFLSDLMKSASSGGTFSAGMISLPAGGENAGVLRSAK